MLTLIIIILAIVAIILICNIVSMSNSLNKAIVKIDEASSGIDVALTKRYDTLTKMIDAVKSYTKYEQATVLKTIEFRKNMTMKEKNQANIDMEENKKNIYALVENYPELKASENYKKLQQSIADSEEHLQAARRLYNANVSSYNQKIVSFPSSIVAKLKGLTKKDFFNIDDTKRNDVKIDL